MHGCASGYSWLIYRQYRAVSKSRIKINIENAMFQNQYSISRMTFQESISRIDFNIRRLNFKINIKNENWLLKIQNQYSNQEFQNIFSKSISISRIIMSSFQIQNQNQYYFWLVFKIKIKNNFKNQDQNSRIKILAHLWPQQ